LNTTTKTPHTHTHTHTHTKYCNHPQYRLIEYYNRKIEDKNTAQ
jgi:hypothetical protein